MVSLVDIPEPERSAIASLDCPVFSQTPFTAAPRADQRHVAIVSSAGLIVRGERPLTPNDAGYRSFASSVEDGDVLCSHVSPNFDRTGFQQDINVMLPRTRLQELECNGSIARAADTHYSFMGATAVAKLEDKARELGRSMLALGVNTVVLAPV